MNAVTRKIVPIPTLYSNFFFICKDMTLLRIVEKTEHQGRSVDLISGTLVNSVSNFLSSWPSRGVSCL